MPGVLSSCEMTVDKFFSREEVFSELKKMVVEFCSTNILSVSFVQFVGGLASEVTIFVRSRRPEVGYLVG